MRSEGVLQQQQRPESVLARHSLFKYPQFNYEVQHPEDWWHVASGLQADDNLHVMHNGELSCARAAAPGRLRTGRVPAAAVLLVFRAR